MRVAVRVAAIGDLWDGEMCAVRARGRALLLVKLDGCVYAYDDRCAHLGVPLSEGELADGVLTCRAHHYQYDARTGQGVNPTNLCLRSWPVRLDGAEVTVELDEERA